MYELYVHPNFRTYKDHSITTIKHDNKTTKTNQTQRSHHYLIIKSWLPERKAGDPHEEYMYEVKEDYQVKFGEFHQLLTLFLVKHEESIYFCNRQSELNQIDAFLNGKKYLLKIKFDGQDLIGIMDFMGLQDPKTGFLTFRRFSSILNHTKTLLHGVWWHCSSLQWLSVPSSSCETPKSWWCFSCGE